MSSNGRTSSDVAVSVRGLSKSYSIAHNAAKHTTAGEALMHRLRHPFHREERETFWALNDVSFDIQRGDVVGIIGRNGAGKSTLLKILSRITEPTAGQIDLYGRVGSLLEVGTGFHAELTGRENIFLNGAILGMSRAEIARQFDAIVDFSGTEQFLDTPVKRYSSGMYVRLAFAVAAHLNPEILIVDEVLAVGDAEFQKKCLGKMQDVAASGRTVLFVSHNMATINNLCRSCIVLKGGQVSFLGDTKAAVSKYISSSRLNSFGNDRELNTFRPSWAQNWIASAKTRDAEGTQQSCFPLGGDITFDVTFANPELRLRSPVLGVVINHSTYGTAGAVNTRMTGFEVEAGSYKEGTLRCRIKQFPFLQGHYTADLWLGDGPTDVDALLGYLEFEVEEADIYGTGKIPFDTMGVAIIQPTWKFSDSATLVECYAPRNK